MSGKRTFEVINSLNSLDWVVETKVPGFGGPYSQTEYLMVLLGPILLTAMTMLLSHKLIGWWGVLSVIIWAKATPAIILRMKKNKPKSWFWELRHKLGLGLGGYRHFRRPFSTRAWTGKRTVVRSVWTQPDKAGLVPIKPLHLTYGMPAIRVYDPMRKIWRASITPQPTLGGYAIFTRSYEPGARRVPDYLRNAVLARDENGIAAIQNYVPKLIEWKQPS